jgi:hypothetical protein
MRVREGRHHEVRFIMMVFCRLHLIQKKIMFPSFSGRKHMDGHMNFFEELTSTWQSCQQAAEWGSACLSSFCPML